MYEYLVREGRKERSAMRFFSIGGEEVVDWVGECFGIYMPLIASVVL